MSQVMQKTTLTPRKLDVSLLSWPALIFILSAALRAVRSMLDALWYDEAFTAWMATLSLPNMLTAAAGDVHPPLWYFIEWITIRGLGHSALAVRLPSVLFGSLAAVEVYRLGKRHSEQTGRWASILFALMPGVIYYGAEARMYALLTLLVLVATRSLLEEKWLHFYIALVLTLYTQNLGVVYVAVLLLAALFVSQRRAVLGGIITVTVYLPWSYVLYQQMQNVSNAFWLRTPAGLGQVIYYPMFVTFNTPPQMLVVTAAAVAIGITAATAVILVRQKAQHIELVTVLAAAPPITLYIVSVVWRPIFLQRALMPAGAALLILWAAALVETKPTSRAAILTVLIPTLAATLVYNYWEAVYDAGRSDITYTAEITERYQPGDIVYHGGVDTLIVTRFYLPDMEHYMAPHTSDLAQALTDETKDGMGISAMEQPLEALQEAGYQRAFLIVPDKPVTGDHEPEQFAQILNTYPTLDAITVMRRDLEVYQIFIIGLTQQP